jgi:MFS family permease
MINSLVIIAALGYFVDIYDLVLFTIVRVPSLKALGLNSTEILNQGLFILNAQMIGMLLGGILWGILGDKKGRLSVLFGSILLYSVANLANAFVTTVPFYAIWRFIAGVGLAGELGAGITLVMETLPKNKRGLGATIVASFGVSGAILAGLIAEIFDWKTSYILGGIMGLLLLFLRVKAFESGLYKETEKKSFLVRGSFLSLFQTRTRFMRYLRCICIGIPFWYVVGILVAFSPELAKAMGIPDEINAGKSIMFCYFGLVIGDVISGFLSQILKSRKKIITLFLSLSTIFTFIYLYALPHHIQHIMYIFCLLLGIASGYWVLFVTIGAESFGTNLRSTVATTVPNFVRGAIVPISLLFKSLQNKFGIIHSSAIVGFICFGIAFFALIKIKETFHQDMDFIES